MTATSWAKIIESEDPNDRCVPVVLGETPIGLAHVSATDITIVAAADRIRDGLGQQMNLHSIQTIFLGLHYQPKPDDDLQFPLPTPGQPLGDTGFFTCERVLVRDENSAQYGWVGYVESLSKIGNICVVFKDRDTPRLKAFASEDLEAVGRGA